MIISYIKYLYNEFVIDRYWSSKHQGVFNLYKRFNFRLNSSYGLMSYKQYKEHQVWVKAARKVVAKRKQSNAIKLTSGKTLTQIHKINMAAGKTLAQLKKEEYERCKPEIEKAWNQAYNEYLKSK